METLVLVLTDAQGSTRLWAQEPETMDAAMRRHHEIVHGAVEAHGGFRPPDQGEGDAVFAAFTSPIAAISAIAELQRNLHTEDWPTSRPLRVRVGVHAGEVRVRDGNLFGDPVNRCARIRGLATGGQTLISAAVFELVRDRLPDAITLSDLGEHRMKDLTRPERIYQLDVVGLPAEFPPLPSLNRIRHNLPVHATAFVGRERELSRVIDTVHAYRLTMITGFGGMGKTRLALQAAAELAGESAGADQAHDGVGDVWLVDLTQETDPDVVPARVAEAAGVTYADNPGAALINAYKTTPVLFVLDNLEPVLGCAPFIAELLASTVGIRVLATSREALRIRGEHLLPLEPMALPEPDQITTPEALGSYEAVRFFLDRVHEVKAGFAVTNDNASAVAAVCARLDGLPLALELAAARLRMFSIEALLSRLDAALKILKGGNRDMPTRHQTLRATIAWSFDTLDEDERALLARLATLPAPADFEFIEAVYGDGLDVFTVLETLVDRSMIRNYEPDDTHNDTRYGLLVAVRDYAAEHLEVAEREVFTDRHADHVTKLLSASHRTEDGTHAGVVHRLLAHVRAALEKRRSTLDQRFVDLVVATDDVFSALGLGNEIEPDLLATLSVAEAPSDRATLLLALAAFSATAARSRRSRAAWQASIESGDPSLIGAAAQSMVVTDIFGTELDEVVAVWEACRNRLEPRQRARRDMEFANCLGMSLRYADPARAEDILRAQLAVTPQDGTILVRLVRVLLDQNRSTEANELFESVGASVDYSDDTGWANLGDVERGRVAMLSGDYQLARSLVLPAFEFAVISKDFPLYAGQVLTDLHRCADDATAVVHSVDRALTTVDELGYARGEALRWRRGRALLELGKLEAARGDLEAARHVLAADPAQGPLELLGCLAALALLVQREDPDQAAELLQTIADHRGNWVLPHFADRDVSTVSSR